MEKKIKFVSPYLIVIIIVTFTLSFVAGFLSYNNYYWYLPVIGGLIAVIGEITSYRQLIDTGMLLSILLFFYLNYTLPFNMMNLAFLLIIFTTLAINWVFARNNLVISQIERELVDSKNSTLFKEYKSQSTADIISTLFTAFVISFLGSIIALYSYTDILISSSIAVPLAIIFSATVFGVIYMMIEVLPRYLKE